MSRISDIGLSFYAMKCRKLSTEKILKVSLFLHKKTTKTSIKNLRQASLDLNVYYMSENV